MQLWVRGGPERKYAHCMGRLLTALILSALALGCGAEERRAPEPADPSPAPITPAPEEIEPLEDEAEDEAEEADEMSVEDMNRAQLEAACYGGRQAACDLLGH